MRLAIFHPTLPHPRRKPGGVEVFVHRLANALTARGHAVDVLTHSAAPSDALYRTRRLRPYASEHRRFLRQYGSAWAFNFRSFDGYDVAHFHGDDWFFLRRPLPVVRTFHGSALLEALSAESLKRRLDKTLVFALELWAARLATATYGVGVDSEIIYRAQGMLNLGIDLPEVAEKRSANPSILFVGTWEGRKRGSLLHKVFSNEVRRSLPDAELWMVSDRCEITDGVRWFDNPTDDELRDLFLSAWTFCLPSSYEGFGLPYLEGMAHGVPVVGTPNPGSRMLLAGNCGILAEDHQLGVRLVELLTDPGLRGSLADNGRERAREYSWARMVEHHEDAYRLAIERWARGA